MKRLIFIALIIVLVAGLVLAGCQQTSSTTSSPTSTVPTTSKTTATSSSTTSAEIKTLNYGVIAPVTGPVAKFGLGVLRSVQMVADRVNANGTLGNNGPGILVGGQRYKINVVSYDDQFDPAMDVTGLRRLAEQSGVKIVQGPITVPCVLSAMSINQDLGVLLGAQAGSDGTQKMGNKLIIHDRIGVEWAGVPLAEGAIDQGWKKGCVVTDGSNPGWVDQGLVFQKRFQDLGGTILAFEQPDASTTTDYHSIMTKLSAMNPDFICIFMLDPPTAIASLHARDVGYAGPFVFNSEVSTETEKAVGLQNLEGSILNIWQYTMALKYPEMDTKGIITDLVKEYTEQFGESPQPSFEPAHDQAYILMRAMELAGTVSDVTAIRASCNQAVTEGKLPLIFSFTKILDTGLPYGGFDQLAKITGGKYVVIKDSLVLTEEQLAGSPPK